jgi:potassium-transporting ATPase KdpC subunit
MKTLLKTLYPALVLFGIFTILCGVLYTGAVTGIARLLFPRQAAGSIISAASADGTRRDYGSALIAQEFSKPEYLIGRPIGATNLSPSGKKEKELVQERIQQWHTLDPSNTADIPIDLVTASGSGADPHISPAAAEYQVGRIARERGISEAVVRAAVRSHTTGRFLGIFGEAAVNVLEVNLTLDGLL